MISKIKFSNFTAFEKLDIQFSEGINVFIGENGTGKTHILKAAYAACCASMGDKTFAQKLNNVFYPKDKLINRLVKRTKGSSSGYVEVTRKLNNEDISIKLSLTNHTVSPETAKLTGTTKQWRENPITATYIPVKDMMANAPGFRSLYTMRNIHFEEVYLDILDRAYLPALTGSFDDERSNLLSILQKAIDGKVIEKNEEFYLKNKQGELEFTLLAEGFRKLGLLWVLIQNGSLLNGSVLFWDEPETNLNPKLAKTIIQIFIQLEKLGVQIFISTHDYVFLKEFDLALNFNDKIIYHSLFRSESNQEIKHTSTNIFSEISNNSIDEAFESIIDRQISKDVGGIMI